MSTTTLDAFQKYTARKMKKQLRRSEAEQTKKNQAAFDYQIKIVQLEREIEELRKERRRRSARAPIPIESFYDQGPDIPEDDASDTPSPYNFDSVMPTAEPPRRESDARSLNAYSETSGRGGGGSQVAAPAANEHLFSRQMYEDELSEITCKKESLEEQVTKEILKSSALEQCVDELKREAEAAADIHRQELRHLESKRKEIEDLASAKSKEFERGMLIKEAAERRASLAEARANELSTKYHMAAMQLEAERRRIEEWEKSRQKDLCESGDLLRNPGELDALLKDMDTQRFKLDNAKYSKTWRDDVLRNMDLCLRILYACETEVVGKRSVFVQRSCAATAGSPFPVI